MKFLYAGLPPPEAVQEQLGAAAEALEAGAAIAWRVMESQQQRPGEFFALFLAIDDLPPTMTMFRVEQLESNPDLRDVFDNLPGGTRQEFESALTRDAGGMLRVLYVGFLDGHSCCVALWIPPPGQGIPS